MVDKKRPAVQLLHCHAEERAVCAEYLPALQLVQPAVPVGDEKGNILEYFPAAHGTQLPWPDAPDPVVDFPVGQGRHTEYVCSYLPGAHECPTEYSPGATTGTWFTVGEICP